MKPKNRFSGLSKEEWEREAKKITTYVNEKDGWMEWLLIGLGITFWGIVFKPALIIIAILMGIKFYQIVRDIIKKKFTVR